jgi:hypothetical protein
VPLHTDHPPLRVSALDSFNDAIVGPRRRAQVAAETIDCLMMDGVYVHRMLAHDGGEPRRSLDAHRVDAGRSVIVEVVGTRLRSL